ncbi:MAG: acyl-CoA dehydrogenase family protein [Hyphomicrobiales bacterium]|nr:acyl-CoA dehydrogenase family protein [Hyphomicrobiales bacterium]
MAYVAPVADILFTLNYIAGFPKLVEQGLYDDLDADTASAILEEAGKFASEQLAPLNWAGDQQGSRLIDGRVITPDGWTEAYGKWVEAGWGSLTAPKEYGGQALPHSLALAADEMWNAANMAFGLCPLLTQGAVEAINAHGSQELKDKYLAKMVSGEWTGTMQLTEPQAGSDLRFLKTRAEPQGDGTYKITGTKIYITYGDHEMTDNIIHLVLARLPDAPPGTRGISLFLVPKHLVNADGSLGARNDVYCAKLEHKIGIHASPTCVMIFGDKGGATGWMVGEPNRGLQAMFTMMIAARLAVGAQGVGIGDRAFQHALQYARDRKQGGEGDQSEPILEHPDVARMLLNMKAKVAAARAISLTAGVAMDVSFHAADAGERERAGALAALLTPVAKAYGTDVGVEVASKGIQVHGGMGYVEETGAAQHLRDARIAPIYEGTNGIQAIDLVTRKLPLGGGQVVAAHIEELRAIVRDVKASNELAFGLAAVRLSEAVDALDEATRFMLAALRDKQRAALSVATPFLRLFGVATGGVYLAKGALAAARGAGEAQARIALARHFAEHLAPETSWLKTAVTTGYSTIAEDAAAVFAA